MKIFYPPPLSDQLSPFFEQKLQFVKELNRCDTTDSSTSNHTSQSTKQPQNLFKTHQSDLKKSNTVFIDTALQYIEFGFYISLAITYNKPIIILCENINNLHPFYNNLTYDKLLFYECHPCDYQQIITQALSEVTKLIDKRFTLLLPPDIITILDTYHRHTGQSRSEFIRNLVRKYNPINQETSTSPNP